MSPIRTDTPETLVPLCNFQTRQTASPLESESPADTTLVGLRQDVLSGQCLLCLEPKHYEMRLRAWNMTNILRCVCAQYASNISTACKVSMIFVLMQRNHTFFLKGSSFRSIAWERLNYVRNCYIMWVIQLWFPQSTFCFPRVTLMRLFASCQLWCLPHFKKWHKNRQWHKAFLVRKTLF